MVAVTSGENIFNVGDNLNYSSKILAAVDLYGVLDLKEIAKVFPLAGFYDANDQVSLMSYITENSAPMLLMHGMADNIVSPAQTELFFQALKNFGIEAERYLVPNANHADDYWQQEEVLEVIAEFLTAHL